MPVIRVLEVATFYTMYNLAPVGASTSRSAGRRRACCAARTSCLAACKRAWMSKGHTTEDGLWTLTEVECLGSCASAPMVQINDDNYEDLTAERLDTILDGLAVGARPKAGTQEPGRHTVEPLGGPTTLKEMVGANHDTGASGHEHRRHRRRGDRRLHCLEGADWL
jgi:NADH-quinone oxidoreductase subunit E